MIVPVSVLIRVCRRGDTASGASSGRRGDWKDLEPAADFRLDDVEEDDDDGFCLVKSVSEPRRALSPVLRGDTNDLEPSDESRLLEGFFTTGGSSGEAILLLTASSRI